MSSVAIRRKLQYLIRLALPPRRLRHVEIETTSYCNRKCVYCPNFTVGRPEEMMKDEVFEKIVSSLAKMKFRGRLSPHFYGEPLCDPRLPRLMKHAADNLPDCEIIIYTNGDFLTVEKFLELRKAGVKRFRVSMHSKRPGKELAETLEHVSNNADLKDAISVVNYYEAFQAMDSTHLNNRGGLVKIARRKAEVCAYANQLTINYLGDAVLCCNDYNATVTFGNVMEREIGDIWRDRAYVKARAMVANGIFPYDICRTCNV
ncbi:MAG: radical SAM/SPASM domain-containing protein [Nitrospinae bacterium]|nr:radical SAM/SPASM domain-containing protein [Nitrospinota bacterium]